jgi:hypothetical protein
MMRAALVVLGLWCAAPGTSQELTVEQLLDRMDAASARSRGVTFDVFYGKEWGGGKETDVAIARDGGVRARDEWPIREMVLTSDSLFLLERDSDPISLGSTRLRASAERIAVGTPCSRGPFKNTVAEAFLHLLSPRRAFAFEPDLRTAGRRPAGGEDCLVLTSFDPRPRRFYGLGGGDSGPPVEYRGELRSFFVGAADFVLRSIETRTLWSPSSHDTVEGWRFEAWEEGVPRRVAHERIESSTEATQAWVFRVPSVRSAPELEGKALRPPAEDLYATHARDPGLPILLEKRPDDPELLYSRALAMDEAESSGSFLMLGASEDLLRALERTVSSRWAPSPVLALLSSYYSANAKSPMAALIGKIEKDPGRSPGMSADAAQGLVRLGEFDRALALVPKAEGPWRKQALQVRAAAWIAKGEIARALQEIGEVPDGILPPGLLLEFRALANPKDDRGLQQTTRNALAQALEARPKTPFFNELAISIPGFDGGFVPLCQALAESLGRTDGTSVREMAFQALFHRLHPSEFYAQRMASKEEVREAFPQAIRALKALGPGPQAAVLGGLLQAKLGDRPAAAREFDQACDLLVKEGDRTDLQRAAPTLVAALEELGDDALFRKAVRASLDRARALALDSVFLRPLVGTYVRWGVRNGRRAELFQDLKGIGLTPSEGLRAGFDLKEKLAPEERLKLAAAWKEEALRHPDDSAGLKWLARSIEEGEKEQGPDLKVDPAELYEKARERAPRDLEILTALARRYRNERRTDAARKAIAEILAELEAGREAPRTWTRTRARLLLAAQELQAGDKTAARATLETVDPRGRELKPWDLWLAGSLFERLGDTKRAIDCGERARQEGYRPYLRLSRLYGQVEESTEMMRNFNRAIAEEFDMVVAGPLPFLAEEADGPVSPGYFKAQRAEFYERKGADYFARRLMAAPPRMTAAEETVAREALAGLSGNNPEEREKGFAALRQLGVKSTAVLKVVVDSEDSEVRLRARELLFEWAEPR